MTMVHILKGYNHKHPRTWDENFIYTQHSYNRTIHHSTSKSPFGIFFGYFPHSPLDVVHGKQGGVREYTTLESLNDTKFIDKIKQIHLLIQETLKKSKESTRLNMIKI
jgi:hypothetical protein